MLYHNLPNQTTLLTKSSMHFELQGPLVSHVAKSLARFNNFPNIIAVEERKQSSAASSSRPQEPRALDLLSPSPHAGAQVALMPNRSDVDVNGVQLTSTSPIRSLRAACSYLDVSTSGSKAKLFDRILSFYDEQQLAVAQKIKTSLGPSVSARKQRLIEPLTPTERREHELTHQSY